MTDNNRLWEAFVQAARQLGIELTPTQLERFQAYERLLREWNERVNLISRKDITRVVGYHFLDSLAASTLIPERSQVCDVGAGAGLPGIPLKMVRADIELTLVESVQKKANFLNQAVRHLGLDRTVVLGIRAEEIRDRQFDVVLCRLLGKIREVVPLTAHVLSPQGRLIFYKTPRNDPEMKQAQRVLDRRHLRIEEVRDVHLRFPEEFVRRLVVIARTQ